MEPRTNDEERWLSILNDNTLTMDEEAKKQWIKDLRSGDFQQGKGTLWEKDDVEGTEFYCCLGVLANRIETHSDDWVYNDMLPPFMCEKVALNEDVANALAGLNDTGWEFSAIADLIEEHL